MSAIEKIPGMVENGPGELPALSVAELAGKVGLSSLYNVRGKMQDYVGVLGTIAETFEDMDPDDSNVTILADGDQALTYAAVGVLSGSEHISHVDVYDIHSGNTVSLPATGEDGEEPTADTIEYFLGNGVETPGGVIVMPLETRGTLIDESAVPVSLMRKHRFISEQLPHFRSRIGDIAKLPPGAVVKIGYDTSALAALIAMGNLKGANVQVDSGFSGLSRVVSTNDRSDRIELGDQSY